MITHQEIVTWLKGLRPWTEGVALYDRYGVNRMYKEMFRLRGENVQTRGILVEELRKIAGLTDDEMRRLKRTGKPSPARNPQTAPPKNDQTVNPQNDQTATKVIRFRERFPFLNEESCPDVLKVLVADLFTAYGRYKEAHARLVVMPDSQADATAEKEAAAIVENYIENHAIWDELEHYRDHGTLLGRHPKVKAFMAAGSFENMSDIDVQRALANARSNLSKAKKKYTAAGDDESRQADAQTLIDKWEAEKTALEAEVERRKKN